MKDKSSRSQSKNVNILDLFIFGAECEYKQKLVEIAVSSTAQVYSCGKRNIIAAASSFKLKNK